MENNETDKKMKPFQLKYSVNNSKFPLSTKSMQQKLSLRNNAFKPINRRAENNEGNVALKSQLGQRGSVSDIKKFNKGDGFDMLARGTDGFKKYEPIGRTLQTFQTRKGTAGNPHQSSQQQNRPNIQYNNFGVYTAGLKMHGQKFQRANSSSQGFKTQNNFMKTSTEGFSQQGSKRNLGYGQQFKKNFNMQSNSNIKNNEQEGNNNNQNEQNQKNMNNDVKNVNENSRNSNTIPQNTTQATQQSSTNGFNFKKPTSKDSQNRQPQTITQKKLNDAMNKASLYNDNVIKRQHAFEQQEKEEELQFIELCGLLNNLITEQ